MRSRTTLCSLLLLSGLTLSACGDDAVSVDGGDGTDAGPGASRDAGQFADTGPATDSGVAADDDDTFDTAQALTFEVTDMVNQVTVDAVLGTPSDLDYYSFEGSAGDWVVVSTSANPDDDTTMVDTVISLFDSARQPLAENDDSQPRVNTDSEVIIRLPADGTYYALVQEFSTWNGSDELEGMASYTYELSITHLNPEVVGINLDAEGGDDLASAQALTFNATFALVYGTFDDATDVDVFSFAVIDGAARYWNGSIMAAGATGSGSTGTPSQVWITSEDGTEIIARVDPSTIDDIAPSLEPGSYRLYVEHGADAAGANDFFVLKGGVVTDNAREMNEILNNEPATPETLDWQPLEGVADTSRAFIRPLIADGDDDYFAVTVAEGQAVSIFCGSATSGSGVIGLTAELVDTAGAPLAPVVTATETATTSIRITDAAVPAAGDYLIHISKTGQDATVTGNWARCGFLVGPPEAP